MTNYANGRLPQSVLTTWHNQPTQKPTANALTRLAAAAEKKGWELTIPGYGSLYRDWDCQEVFFDASRGNVAAAHKAGLNPNSSIRVSAPGGSSHGNYRGRADFLFDGSSHPSTVQISWMADHGWIREFGGADGNHFEHDGKTWIAPITDAAPVHKPLPKPAVKKPGLIDHTLHTGDRNAAFWLRAHYYAKLHGYTGRLSKTPMSPGTLKYLQHGMGVAQTGAWDHATIKAIQVRANRTKWVKVAVDGIAGPYTWMGFSAYLNTL